MSESLSKEEYQLEVLAVQKMLRNIDLVVAAQPEKDRIAYTQAWIKLTEARMWLEQQRKKLEDLIPKL